MADALPQASERCCAAATAPKGVRAAGPNSEHACVRLAEQSQLVVTMSFGEVSEWLKEHAWKVCIRQRIEGSNPSLTAK